MTDQIGENEKKFLLELFKQSKGSTSAKISMYDVGAAVGLDKSEAKRIAEEMMAWNLIEIRSLSGGIAMTDQGLGKAREMGASGAGSDTSGVRLGNTPVLNDTARQAVGNLAAALKIGITKSELNFDMLNELIADIRTIEAQLFSPKPKTAIIRECLHSIQGILKSKEYSDHIRSLLGE